MQLPPAVISHLLKTANATFLCGVRQAVVSLVYLFIRTDQKLRQHRQVMLELFYKVTFRSILMLKYARQVSQEPDLSF
ncbi:MAG: hypothetical protein ABR556_00715 [Pyrinomonadaceae bacterium]